MAFLIFTERGYRDLIQSTGKLPSPLWVNPGILSGEEIARLREVGVQINILSHSVDLQSRAQIEQALRQIKRAGTGRVWVEQIPAAIQEDDMASKSSVPVRDKHWVSAASSSPVSHRNNAWAAYGRTLHYIRRLSASDGAVTIIPYRSYGTSRHLRVQGRVLKNKGFGTPDPNQSAWSNFIEFYKQLGSDEVPGARIVARFGEVEQEAVADNDGYFHAELALPHAVEGSGWQSVELELLYPAPRKGEPVQATAKVLIPSPAARFGVISDIDDTVLWSNVGNKLRMLKMLAVSNAHTRKPFKGVTAFYCALQQGASGNENNPIFYVSSSPWHLYTQLVDFFVAQGIPLGPLVLKQLGVKALFGSKRHHDHKLANIERILQAYPDLPFILIGDSGQHDPEIYKQVMERHPKRILAIYIRNVNPDPARIEAIDRLIDEVKATDTQLLLVPDSEFAAMHAAGEGWIKADGLNTIRSDKRDDERLSNPKI